MATPTPPPHTPVLYLKGGGSGFFSKKCQAELIKAQMNPDHFGSYNHVSKLNAKARKKVKAWDALSAAQQAANPAKEPTREDRYLADCQAGHLIRDSNFRDEGGRNDPCANRVDGFLTNHAPCVPQSGRASDPTTEHGAHTTRENQDSAAQRDANDANGDPRAGDYTQAQRQAHEDARTSDMLDARAKDQAARDSAYQQGANAADPGSTASAENAARDKLGAKPPKEPDLDASKQIEGESAEECINNWRKAAEEEMKKKCKQNLDKYEAKSTAPPPATNADHQAALNQKAADAAAKAEASGTKKDKRAATRAKSAATRFRNNTCLADQASNLNETRPGTAQTTGRAA